MIRFDGFLKLYQEGRDDEEDEEAGRLPPMAAGEQLTKDRIEATQHFTEPPPRYTEATPRQADGGTRHRPAFDLCLDARRAA